MGTIKLRKDMPSHNKRLKSVAPQGQWAVIQSQIAADRAASSTLKRSIRKKNQRRSRLSTIPNASVSASWWRWYRRGHALQKWHSNSEGSANNSGCPIAADNRAGASTPPDTSIRERLGRLIRSSWVPAERDSDTRRRPLHRPQ